MAERSSVLEDSKKVTKHLRVKVQEFLSSRKYANNLAEILELFESKVDNFIPVLLCCETIFKEILNKREMILQDDTLGTHAEREYIKWLQECYENSWNKILHCMTHGKTTSRVQAIITAMNLLQCEGQHPFISCSKSSFYFPINRLTKIFGALINDEISMLPIINQFEEFIEYGDVCQFGLKALISLSHKKHVSPIYICNFIEILDKLLSFNLDIKNSTSENEQECNKILCASEKQPQFHFSVVQHKKNANKAWAVAVQWPLCSDAKAHRRVLLLLIEKLLPLLSKPELATDMLMDSMDSGGAISVLALQGILEVVRRHNIDYPDIYDRLYAMLEPEMFSTKYKTRLLHLTDVFLTSTHLPEALVAAFAKRLARLSLIAPPEDAILTLQIISNLTHQHHTLKKMICTDATHTVMSGDPYVAEETSPSVANALGSSLWEVAALRSHALPSLAAAANRLIVNIDSNDLQPLQPIEAKAELFDTELKKRFKSIEVNFLRPQSLALPSGERLSHYWNLVD